MRPQGVALKVHTTQKINWERVRGGAVENRMRRQPFVVRGIVDLSLSRRPTATKAIHHVAISLAINVANEQNNWLLIARMAHPCALGWRPEERWLGCQIPTPYRRESRI